MKRTFPLLLVFFLVLFALLGHLDAQVSFVDGTVMNAQGQPLPGVTVSLVHQSLGRSTPAITDVSGHFFIPNVPMNQNYYFEIYWGNQIIYRNTLLVVLPMQRLGFVVVQ
jgi:hypothetical protein